MRIKTTAGMLLRGSHAKLIKFLMNGALLLALLMVDTVDAQAANKIIEPSEELPAEIEEACEKWGKKYDICPELLESFCYHETRYWSEAVNGPCKGSMQINVPCHQDRLKKLGVTDIFDYDQNIHVGADLLAELFSEYEDTAAVVMLYHGESNAVDKANKNRLSSYCKAILEKSEELEREHGKK